MGDFNIMKNVAHIAAQLYLLLDTDLDEKSFLEKFNIDSIVGCKLQLTTPDGSVHNVAFANVTGFDIEDFEDNNEK